MGSGGGLRQIKHLPQGVNFLDNDIWHCILSVYSFYGYSPIVTFMKNWLFTNVFEQQLKRFLFLHWGTTAHPQTEQGP